MREFKIESPNKSLEEKLQRKIDFKTKPLGALGKLEDIALKIGQIQNSTSPTLINPHIIVFAGDHGIVKEGVSAYPQEVTYQMVMNFLGGGAAINVFCKQNDIALKVVDAGVNYNFSSNHNQLIDAKVGMGTRNFLHEPAMSSEEVNQCIENGASIIQEIKKSGCNIIGFGEMGIGNTSSASAIFSVISSIHVDSVVGKGTGLDEEGVNTKASIIKKAIENHKESLRLPIDVLRIFGGFEIAQMTGAMLEAAASGMTILVDGFIATSAFIVAYALDSKIIDYAIFTHLSGESGHKKMLEYLNVKPLVDLNMRLGEGTGIAVTYPIIKSAMAFLNSMASFESAGVSNKENTLNNA